MKTIQICSLLLVALRLLAWAETQTLEGYLVDQKCMSYYLEQPDKIQGHSRACVLACGRESGYGVTTADQNFILDAEGRKLAQTWLETSSKEKDLRVKVTVVHEDGKSRVVKIE